MSSKRKRQDDELQQQSDDLKLIKKPLKFSIDSIMSNNQQLHLQSQQQQLDSNLNKKYSIDNVECTLDNQDIWKAFNSLNTEMIITKTGRRMFPVMKVQFHNLSPNARYAVSMDIVPVDTKRYRYAYHKSCWQVAGKADPSAEPRLYAHPDSPLNGDLLSRQVISFEKVKLTNNEADKSGHIILNSMHKYQPRVHLIELKQTLVSSSTTGSSGSSAAGKLSTSASGYHNHYNNNNNHHHNHQNNHHKQQQQPQPQLDIEGYKTFVFPETVFTAVTAYQNQLITKMKIDKNPFAKGFRDSSRLSDLDRSDPFDYMGPLGSGGRPPPGSLEAAAAAAAAAAGSNIDTYQLLASSPWYSAAAMAAAAASSNVAATGGGGGGGGPFGSIGQAACSTAQAAQAAQQLQAHMWLAAFNACLGGAAAGGALGTGGPSISQSPIGMGGPPAVQMAAQPPIPPTTTATTTPNGTLSGSPVNPFAAAAAAMLQMPPSSGQLGSPHLTVDGDDDDEVDGRDDDGRDGDDGDLQRNQNNHRNNIDDDEEDDASENEQNHQHHQHHHHHQNNHHNHHQHHWGEKERHQLRH